MNAVRSACVQLAVTNPNLSPCPLCGWSGKQLQVMKHTDALDGVVVTTYFIRCGCPEPKMFATDDAARDAWQQRARRPAA